MNALNIAALKLAVIKVMQDALKAEQDMTRDGITEDLRAGGIKTLDVALPDGRSVGTLSLVKRGGKLAVKDADEFGRWMHEHYPECVRVEHVPAHDIYHVSSDALKAFDAQHGCAVDPSTGEVVDGLTVEDTAYTSSIRPTDKHAIIAAWRAGHLAELLPGVAPALPGGDE